MSEVCFICDKPLKESEVVFVVGRMKTLIDASVERNDNFFEYLKDKQSVTVHVQCRKMYTRKSSIVAAKRQRETEQDSTSTISPPHTRARVSEPDFNFKRYFAAIKQMKKLKRRKRRMFVVKYIMYLHLNLKIPF